MCMIARIAVVGFAFIFGYSKSIKEMEGSINELVNVKE